MLPIQLIKQNPESVKEKLKVKNFTDIALVDTIIQWDDDRRKMQHEFDEKQSFVNSTSKEIGALMSKGQKEEAEVKKQEVASLKNALQPISEKLAELEKDLQNALVKLPNLPADIVPAGTKAEDNITVKEGGAKPSLSKNALAHWDLIKK
ncbi:MAG TPA: serine--tRNA ligase, partial [Chitinophagaceae bacterium]|nr:serine--tRNA ligase [Chitinophagaceae bacterium]